METPRVAFLSQDAVFVVDPDGAPRQLESAFAEGVRERARIMARGKGWKAEGTGGFLSGAALWGAGAVPDGGAVNVAARGLAAGGRPGELVYGLESGPVAGAFRYDLANDEEARLFHGNHHAVGPGKLHVIARHALAFDVATDRSVLVSNGSAIDRITPDGGRERICKAPSIEQVVALG